MNNTTLTHSLRFIFLVFLQVLVFRQMTVGWGDFNYVHVMIYPLFILLLPIRIPDPLLIFLGFLIGLTVDVFYISYGIHASASVFLAFIRPLCLKVLTPRGGYNITHSPNIKNYGFVWFLIYSSLLMFFHLLFYFTISIFTHIYWVEIILRTISSFVVSYVIILLYLKIFNPRD
jgi:hypothetical protein